MPTLTIDKQTVTVPEGTRVIDAAARLGIVIPRFCFHPALGAVGACRVCAVGFLDGPVKGVQMSCMVAAADGMVVSTTDAEAVDFRRHVIELLMVNHPHDCPVCDEGGHCLLQDTTVAGGHGRRRFKGLKRTHRDQDLGPLVQHEMNRCIQCYRCVRFYRDYAGGTDLGVTGIGARVYFGRPASGVLESPFAGNLVDICPTGVFTDKPSRFFGRRWDFQRADTLCVHCGLGCHVVASARYRQVVRCEARFNEKVNGHFICDRGRFGYPYANADERPRRARIDGRDGAVEAALSSARRRLDRIGDQYGPSAVAMTTSARSSVETLAALARACNRHGWQGPVSELAPRTRAGLAVALKHMAAGAAGELGDIAAADAVLVAGCDPLAEAPVLALALRQARRNGAAVMVIDPRPVDLPFEANRLAVHPAALADTLAQLAALAADPITAGGDALGRLAGQLVAASRPVIVCGTDVADPAAVAAAVDLARRLNTAGRKARLMVVMPGANAAALATIGAGAPDIEALVSAIEAGQVKALVAVESDLLERFADRPRLEKALARLECLVAMDCLNTGLCRQAAVMIPTRTVFESDGRWINTEGRLQRSRPVMVSGEPLILTGAGDHPPRTFAADVPGGQPRCTWRAVARLAGDEVLSDMSDDGDATLVKAVSQALGGIDLDEACLDQVVRWPEAGGYAAVPDGLNWPAPDPETVTIVLTEAFLGTEPLSVHGPALRQVDGPARALIHPHTAVRLNLDDARQLVIDTGNDRVELAFEADARIAPDVLIVPRHHRLDWQRLGGEGPLAAARIQPADKAPSSGMPDRSGSRKGE